MLEDYLVNTRKAPKPFNIQEYFMYFFLAYISITFSLYIIKLDVWCVHNVIWNCKFVCTNNHIFGRINRTALIHIAKSYTLSYHIPFTWHYYSDERNICVYICVDVSISVKWIASYQLTCIFVLQLWWWQWCFFFK